MSTVTPLEWFHSLNNFISDFYDSQCKVVRAAVAARKKAELSSKNCSNNLLASVKKAPSTIHKTTRKSSLTLETPLKGKSPNSSTIAALSNEPFTPKPSQLSAATPFTEGRSRRTAATKADKYIDIVSRRLAEVPANGSTPKSMKIASKLISEATPNSRRNILLSQTMNSKSASSSSLQQQVQSTPIAEKSAVVIPSETPASVRKRNRTAKIHQMFQTSLMSLASAATEEPSGRNSVGSFSPSNVNVAPSKITRISKLSQVHTEVQSAKEPSKEPSPAKEVKKRSSPVKEAMSVVQVKTASPLKSSAKATSSKKSSPIKKSPRVSPAKIEQTARKPSPLKEPLFTVKPQFPSVAATPKAPVVEFVAPQSVLRSSKRPRKQTLFNDESSANASPALKKQPKLADPSIFPTVSVNSQPQIKIAPQTPAVAPIAPLPQSTTSVAPQTTRISNVNVPAIIVPFSTSKLEESSSAEDLHDVSSSRRTPLRVQPSKTPTRAKAVIPSLSDYSAATKIAVIEVAKNTSNNNNNNSNVVSSTPKVEPWTSKFIQKDAPSTANNTKTTLNINIKPVDTSKISGFANATVPIVPKFPLNLSNISNITKTSIALEHLSEQSVTAADSKPNALKPTVPVPVVAVPPPESPLTRAKRIDLENSSREEKLKTMMETKADKLKKAMGELKSVEEPKNNVTVISSANIPSVTSAPMTASSKLPVKPKANATVLPSPKIPSRLAEAFSGIDSELPPIDIGLVDDEKILKNVLGSASTKEASASAPSGFINPKMKKQPAIVNNENKPVSNNANPTATPNNSATQLHRTAVLNSAARKINEVKPVAKPTNSSNVNTATTSANLPVTPKPLPPKATADSSSPFLPEIPSDDELEKREKMAGKENRPTWAMTPNLKVALNAQRSQRAEDVFGKVQPIKLEDFFKGSGKKFPNRSSTSNWNNNI